MDIKMLALAHGEKALVALALLYAGISINGILSDENSLRKEGAQDSDIEAIFSTVNEAEGRNPPTPEPAPQFIRMIDERLSVPVQETKTVNFLSKHVDISEAVTHQSYLYGYKIEVPEFNIVDEIGAFVVEVILPEEQKSTGRLGEYGEFVRERSVSGQQIKNMMRPVGMEIQIKRGMNDWEPAAIGNGYQSIKEVEDVSGRYRIDNVRVMQNYKFRARMIVVGTGHKPGDADGNDIVVFKTAPNEEPDWATLSDQLEGTPGLAEEVEVKQYGVRLSSGERAYAGEWSDEYAINSQSDIRMGLWSISPGLGEDAQDSATIYVRKLLRHPVSGDELGWTEPVKFKVKVGEELGSSKVKVKDPQGERSILVDMQTKLKVTALTRESKRVYYYRVNTQTDVALGKKLIIQERGKDNIHMATLEHVDTGAVYELVQLKNIIARPNDITFPIIPEGGKYNEQKAFGAADPTWYRQPDLLPQAPVWHSLDDKLLFELAPLAQTNQDYIEFADGRLVYYDHVNKKIEVIETVPLQTQAEDEVDAEGNADASSEDADEKAEE